MPVLVRLFTIAEVAELLRLTPASVRRHIARGSLEAIKLPHGHLRVEDRAVRDFLDEGSLADRE